MNKVSVIVLCKDQQVNLPLIFEALGKQALRPDEVIIADDQSMADISAIAKRFGCRYVSTAAHVNGQRNGVRSLARQIGTQIARYDVLAYLDGDIIPSLGFLQIGVETARRGKLVKAPRRYRIAQDGSRREHAASGPFGSSEQYLGFAEFTSDSFVVSRDAVNAVGGWDERFEGWGEEDIEFAFRCECGGLPIVEVDQPDFFGIHLDHPINYAKNFASLTRNATYFAQKHPAMHDLRTTYWESMGLYLAQYGCRKLMCDDNSRSDLTRRNLTRCLTLSAGYMIS